MSLWTWIGQNISVVADVLTALALAAFAWMQWRISRRDERDARANEAEAETQRRRAQLEQDRLRHEADELHRVRERDTQIAAWGAEVIDVLAGLEVLCDPLANDKKPSAWEFETASARTSALVDRGRMFFPNVMIGQDPDGIRVQILDHILRACYVARHMAVTGARADRLMRYHVWQARRRFVSLLQAEMKHSLRTVSEDKAGESIPIDPREWDEPTVKFKLPA